MTLGLIKWWFCLVSEVVVSFSLLIKRRKKAAFWEVFPWSWLVRFCCTYQLCEQLFFPPLKHSLNLRGNGYKPKNQSASLSFVYCTVPWPFCQSFECLSASIWCKWLLQFKSAQFLAAGEQNIRNGFDFIIHRSKQAGCL